MQHKKIKIAATGDLHIQKDSAGMYKPMFNEISENADIVILCGDLTDLGTEEEAHVLAEEIGVSTIPVVAVLGNHDFESDLQKKITEILQAKNIHVLDGTDFIFHKYDKSYGITGVKGFGGGFRPSMWGRFGEKEQKEFYDAINKEVQKLENGLNKLQSLETDYMIVVLHFSPIRQTLEGELQELYPFLGSTRLEEVIDRYNVNAVVHGHAHHGCPEGKTEHNIPVYNVSKSVQEKHHQKPYFIFEI